MSEITINQAQVVVDEWIKKVGVRYFNELTNTALLMEEVGELARIVARRYGEQSQKPNEENQDLGDEIADVLFVLICLANQTGVDLNKAFEKVANTYEFAHLKGGLKGIVVLLINKDNLSSLANISLSKDGIKKSINLKLSDLKQHNSDLPSNIIFDSNGKIIYNNLEAINVFEKINQLITR